MAKSIAFLDARFEDVFNGAELRFFIPDDLLFDIFPTLQEEKYVQVRLRSPDKWRKFENQWNFSNVRVKDKKNGYADFEYMFFELLQKCVMSSDE